MSWPELFIVFLMCHLTGDYLLQTDWQVRNKPGGLGRDPVARRALVSHLVSYTLAFVPALIWVAVELKASTAVLCAIAIAVPHLIVDDRRLLLLYVRRVKRSPNPAADLLGAVDQSAHLIMLWAVAVVTG
jgi:Protein of unknown function (DUF3307)